jgi:hypothetical protein
MKFYVWPGFMLQKKNSKLYSLIQVMLPGFTLALLATPSHAFNLNPATGALVKYVSTEDYTIAGTTYTVSLDPARSGVMSFVNALRADSTYGTASGWIYNLMQPNTLQGTFNIQNYYACPNTLAPFSCGVEYVGQIDVRNGPGAFLDLTVSYNPNDLNQPPNPPTGANFRWLQWINDNHALPEPPGGHGQIESEVDGNPFYPIFPPGNRLSFVDNPTRGNDPANSHFWRADLFLVDVIAPKTVNIYDGISWGWKNYCKQTAAGDGDCKDFGDAPDTYSTTKAKNGPRYGEGEQQRLGQLWDKEIDGQPNSLANGDDIGPPFDDDDGVIFGDSWVDVIFNITRPIQSQYNLRAWWDLNINGIFDQANELIIDDTLGLTAGMLTKRYNAANTNGRLNFDPRNFYSRFRLTLDPIGDVLPYGEVFSRDCPNINNPIYCISHGEVEDYAPVPGPLPILGVGAAFSYARRLRRFSKSLKADKLYA